jgi:hypothetical protein
VAEALARFDEAPSYLEARLGALRSAGFVVLPTGANVDHFDVQLLPGHADEDAGEPVVAVRKAAARLVAAAGELRRNPAYAGDRHRLPEGQ